MGVLTRPQTYESHPEEAWQRLKMRVKNRKALAVLMELAAWRERLAQSQDVPRSRILRDEALYDIANQAPTSAEQLSQLRTLSEGSRARRGRGHRRRGEARPRARHEDRAGRQRGAAAVGRIDRRWWSCCGAAQGVGGAPSRGAEADRRVGGSGAHRHRSGARHPGAQGLAAASCSARMRCG